ncbi:MAG: CdaR family transcriptional regulator [Phycicoccus sp.]
MLTPQLAQSVVDEVTARIAHNINIMGVDGVIIASSDPSRIGVLHAGALEAARTGRQVVVHMRVPDGSQRPGVNLPLTVDGELVGAVGISGDPAEATTLATSVVLLVDLLVRQSRLREDEEWRNRVCQHVVADLTQGTATVDDCLARLRLAGLEVVPPVSVAVMHGAGPTDVTERSLRPLRRLSPGVAAAADRRGRVWAIAFGRTHGAAGHALRIVRDDVEPARPPRVPAASTPGPPTGRAPGKPAGRTPGTPVRRAAIVSAPPQDDLSSLAVTLPQLARATLLPPGEDCSIDDVRLHTVLAGADESDRQALVATMLGRLDDTLVGTVEAFLAADLNLVATADRMQVHRNTVVYRLGRVRDLTGYDPRRGHDAVQFGVALLLDALHKTTPG